MSRGPEFAELAARVLTRGAPTSAPPSPEERAHSIQLIREQIRAKARRQRFLRGGYAAAAVAAATMLYLGARHYPVLEAGRLAPHVVAMTGATLKGEVLAVHDSMQL